MMKEYAAYDNLPAKQSRWELSLHNARDLSWMQQPAGSECDYFGNIGLSR
jgi:hypothetical protein